MIKMRVSVKIGIFCFVACVFSSMIIMGAEKAMIAMGIRFDPNVRVFPFMMLMVSGFAALWTGLYPEEELI